MAADTPPKPVVVLGFGLCIRHWSTFIFSGRSYVEDINKEYNLKLTESDEYETISGLLLDYLECIPEKDNVVSIGDYHFTITNVNETTINEVKLVIIKDDN